MASLSMLAISLSILARSALAASMRELVFASSRPGEAAHSLWSADLNIEGMLSPLKSIPLPAYAGYLVAKEPAECLFALLPEKSEILAFSITASGLVQAGDSISSGGTTPVHGAISANGDVLVVANSNGPEDKCDSSGASVATFKIAAGCALTAVDKVAHSGSSVVKDKQCSAHVHSVATNRENFVFVCDLGQDAVVTYRLSPGGQLNEVARVSLEAGAGPRQAIVHPKLPILYVLNELAMTVQRFSIDFYGRLTPMEPVFGTLDKGQKRDGFRATEMALTADASGLYVLNRAHERGVKSNIASFATMGWKEQHNVFDGSLLSVGNGHTPAPTASHIAMTRTGYVLLMADEASGEIAGFGAGGNTAVLEETGYDAEAAPKGVGALVVTRGTGKLEL
eukprot:gnl/TRDRNA2_/TRDRNA2_198844_c0_seq1.p1 gnl/TRDRNA2_/TRDRNA2_198844_c0~~gnl/TRDRNA2_/TRDRNA2_198844_c0_seq1.p1  ORF type:complete len:396 (+),score=55.34 gnl/TRDRNA2_/TRDRNA2_198844_c0_seq1:58-1245(+)